MAPKPESETKHGSKHDRFGPKRNYGLNVARGRMGAPAIGPVHHFIR